MRDRISLNGIRAFGFHGVFDFEARDGQDFIIDVELTVDLQTASRTDDLADTIDYGKISELVVDEIQGERVSLIERLAGRIADRIMSQFPKVIDIAVTVHKPQAPVSAHVSDILVTVNRQR